MQSSRTVERDLYSGSRYRLKPLSPWKTPWHADTLWGSICWVWEDADPSISLDTLLDGTLTGTPPFLISNGLPGDLLPYPMGATSGDTSGSKSKSVWCSLTDFERWPGGDAVLQPTLKGETPFTKVTLLHAQRNRITDSTVEGELFQTDQYTFNKEVFRTDEERYISVYVRAQSQVLETLTRCLQLLSYKGFGARASTGLGSFEVISGPEPCKWLDITEKNSEFMSLSHFVPAKADPTDGGWRVHLKHPKFAAGFVRRFLKGSLLTLTPGSRFRVSELRPYYGRAIQMPCDEYPKALHYGFSFVAPTGGKG